MALNDKQQLFCREYLVTDPPFNASEAYIKAGYSPTGAQRASSRLLKHPEVTAYVEKLKREREARTNIDADWILTHCSEMLKADVADILKENGSLKPVHDWPLIWRQMLVGVDVKELYEYTQDEGGREKVGELIKAKFINREKILELAGRHVQVKAFEKDTLEIHVHGDLVNRLQAGRRRVIDVQQNLKQIEGGKDE